MPGHSPGSIAVHVPAADAVFVGDALTTRHVLTGASRPAARAVHRRPARGASRRSHRLAGLNATWVLPGHGTPWNGGVEEAVREVEAGGRGIRSLNGSHPEEAERRLGQRGAARELERQRRAPCGCRRGR